MVHKWASKGRRGIKFTEKGKKRSKKFLERYGKGK